MDEVVVRRVKALWFAAWLSVTGVTLAVWGWKAAVAAWLAFVGATVLAIVAFVLNLLLGEEPPARRALLITLFIAGLVVEVGGIAHILRVADWLRG
jgi:hypothetical protein